MKPNLSRLAFLFAAQLVAHADALYNITINTPTLAASPAGPFYLAVQLADGTGTGDGINSAVLTNIQLGGGSTIGPALLLGDAWGSLSSAVVVTDGAVPSYFAQPFTPGGTLSFQLDLTTNINSGGVPDCFVVAILDSSLTPIPTMAGAGFDMVLEIYINSDNPTTTIFAGDTTRSPAAGGPPIGFNAPALQLQCATDVSTSISVIRSGYTYNFATELFSQTVTLTNTSGEAIAGPISIALDDLSENASLFNGAGATSCTLPSGSPYLNSSATTLASGASATTVLQFADPTRASITYNTRVLAGPAAR